jgi:hypothetical protein
VSERQIYFLYFGVDHLKNQSDSVIKQFFKERERERGEEREKRQIKREVIMWPQHNYDYPIIDICHA